MTGLGDPYRLVPTRTQLPDWIPILTRNGHVAIPPCGLDEPVAWLVDADRGHGRDEAEPGAEHAGRIAAPAGADALTGAVAAALVLLIPAGEHGLRLFAISRGLEVVVLVLLMHAWRSASVLSGHQRVLSARFVIPCLRPGCCPALPGAADRAGPRR